MSCTRQLLSEYIPKDLANIVVKMLLKNDDRKSIVQRIIEKSDEIMRNNTYTYTRRFFCPAEAIKNIARVKDELFMHNAENIVFGHSDWTFQEYTMLMNNDKELFKQVVSYIIFCKLINKIPTSDEIDIM